MVRYSMQLVDEVAEIHSVGAELLKVKGVKSLKVICMKFDPVESEEVDRSLAAATPLFNSKPSGCQGHLGGDV